MTSSLLAKLYHKNNEFSVQPLARLRRLDDSEDMQWGGARLRLMLQCIYTIAFLCLLRFDEVLRIELKDIEVVNRAKGQIKLSLPFRKTHQYGGNLLSFCASIFTNTEIKPFHLYFNRAEPHLDPIHHLLRWIRVSRLTTGPLFRRIDTLDRVVVTGSKALVTLRYLRTLIFRHQISSWSISGTISWTSAKTLVLMVHIPFVEEAVSIYQVKEDGISGSCVTGEDGV